MICSSGSQPLLLNNSQIAIPHQGSYRGLLCSHRAAEYKHLVLLCFTLLCFAETAFFLQIEGLCKPISKKSIGAIFPIAFTHFMSLCHILVILPVFQTFTIIIFVVLICGQRSLILLLSLFWGAMNCAHIRQQTLINIVCVLTAPQTNHSAISLPLLRPLYFPRHNNIEIMPNNNPIMASKQSSESESRIFPTLTQKLKMTKLNFHRVKIKLKAGRKRGQINMRIDL